MRTTPMAIHTEANQSVLLSEATLDNTTETAASGLVFVTAEEFRQNALLNLGNLKAKYRKELGFDTPESFLGI